MSDLNNKTSSNTIPDLQEREQALDITQSYLIQAPAGSGKTELLTQRVLKLLSIVNSPEEIIAITFTNKAASEMQERILAALLMAKNNITPTSPHQKNTYLLAQKALEQSHNKNWNLIENPSRLKLLTIDSLSVRLAEQLPISSKMGAQLAISDDCYELYKLAVKNTLLPTLATSTQTQYEQQIKNLLSHLDNNYHRIESLLVSLLAKRDQWLPIILSNQQDHARAALEAQLKQVNQTLLTNILENFPYELEAEIIQLSRYAAGNLNLIDNSNPINHWLDINELPNNNIQHKKHWLGLCELLFTKSGELRKQITAKIGFPAPSSCKNKEEKITLKAYKDHFAELLLELNNHPDFCANLLSLLNSPNSEYTDEEWQVLESLLTLLPIAAAQLRLLFSQYGAIDYIENSSAALLALGNNDEPSDALLSLDYQIKHLLIDEFQDTSSNQFNLLQKLTSGWETSDGRTLFLVGDPMQSIYRFREAEVGLFLHAKHHGIGEVRLNFLALKANFRSTGNIIQWVNQNFKTIFPQTENMSIGAIPYNSSFAIKPKLDNTESYIEQYYLVDSDSESEASYIANKIKLLKKENSEQSIAILVRSRSHLSEILPLLAQENIAYQAIDIEQLSHKPVIQDLFSLTKALLHLGDNIAWLSILRAPWCGLLLTDLFVFSQTLNQADIHSLWQALNQEELINQLSANSQTRLISFIKVIKNSLQQRDRSSLRDWVENTWRNLSGPSCVSSQNDLLDAEQYFKLLEDLDSNNSNGIINIDQLEKKIYKLFASPELLAKNPVQIMTIHKSKGLEFDTVFLPGLHKKSNSDSRELLNWMEYPDDNNIHHLLLAPIAQSNTKNNTYEFIYQQQQIKAGLELDRVLYVAVTRAKSKLILTGLVSSLETEELVTEISAPTQQSMLARFWNINDNLIKQNCHELTLESSSKNTRHSALQTTEKLLARFPIEFFSQNNNNHYHLAPYSTEQDNLPELALNHQYNQAQLGTLIHLLIQKFCENGVHWWQNKSGELKNKIIKALITQYNIPENYWGIAIEKIHLAIQNLLTDTDANWILQAHSEHYSELAITYRSKNNKINSYSLDRAFIDNHNHAWIIDFKTSEPTENQTIKQFVEQEKLAYQAQLKNYQYLLKQLHPNIKQVKTALYFVLIPKLVETS